MRWSRRAATLVSASLVLSLACSSGGSSSPPAPPALSLSPPLLTFTAPIGTAPADAQAVTVSNAGGGALAAPSTSISYAAGATGWLAATPSGAGPYTITAVASPAGLGAGTYGATVSVESAGASNSPQTFEVSFTVVDPASGQPAMELSPTQLDFAAVQGGANPAAKNVTVSNLAGGTLARPTATPSVAWLAASVSTDPPYAVTVQPTVGALVAGTYTATISISSAGASNDPQSIGVTFTVAPPPRLQLASTSLAFEATETGADPGAQVVEVTNAGGGTLTPSATVSLGAPWLSASVSGSGPWQVTVQASVGALAPGVYHAMVSVSSPGASGSPQTIAVTFTVAARPAIALSPPSLSFTATQGGANPAAQSVSVTNGGDGTLAPPTVTIAPSVAWLAPERVTVASAGGYTIQVSPVTGSLPPGTYTTTVSVASNGASNTPQTFGVSFRVFDPAVPAIGLAPAALSFEAVEAGADPASQAVAVSNLSGGTLAAPTATPNVSWLEATVSGYSVAVQPRVGALAVGSHSGTISIASSNASNTPQVVTVTFTVTRRPAIALSATAVGFNAVAGGANPLPKTVFVTNAGGGALATPTTSVSPTSSWLTLAVSGAAAPYTITVAPDITGLSAGASYSATVSVASAGASNTPRSFVVGLAVVTGTCKSGGETCTTGGECCTSACGAGGTCTIDTFCEGPGSVCASDSDCCSVRCTGGFCDAETCIPTGTSCGGDAGRCCSGVCTSGACAALPGGTCKTLGERCTAATDCCSKSCQGAAGATPGWCSPAYTCNATSDVCTRPEDCCSGLCSATAGGTGRCLDASGDCTQDGVPCENDSNCCTKKCVDLGTGTKVCQPAGGCRMTGNFCDRTAACCGGTDPADPGTGPNDPPGPSPYGVFCDGIGQRPGPTEYDTRTQDSRTCTRGTSCNPPGNICGYKASQNCCYDGGSGKEVCKPDSNGILRCFGGPVNATCPSGWDATDPLCCIQPGAVCQFRDQCCDGAPCVPDAAGILRCAAGSEACLARGAGCAPGTSPDPCCTGTTCTATEAGGSCQDAWTCVADGASCSTSDPGACCSGACVASVSDPATGTCGQCAANGSGCSRDSQCCSGACDASAGVCVAPCVGSAGSCTVDGDCCSGLTCDVPPGATSGTCSSTSTCAATGGTCAADADCCKAAEGEQCTGGVCTAPATCAAISASCAAPGAGGPDCCTGLSCVATDAVDPNVVVPCTGGSSSCFCATCLTQGASCIFGGDPCCAGTACMNDESVSPLPCDVEATLCSCRAP